MAKRRDILKWGAGAAIGATFAPGIASADEHGGQQGMSNLFVAALSGDQQTEQVNTDAVGGAVFSYNQSNESIDYALGVAEVKDVTEAHIHLGGPGEDGPVVVPLYPAPDGSGDTGQEKQGRFSGVLADSTITEDHLTGDLEGAAIDELVQSLRDGGAYVNVHTEQNPGGEIRGQIQTVENLIEFMMQMHEMEQGGGGGNY